MKRILITAVSYPPSGEIGAKRPSKMANFLADNDWDVTVLTVDPVFSPTTGRAVAERENLRVIRTKAFVPYVSLRNRVSKSQGKSGKGSTIPIRPKADGGRIFRVVKAFRNALFRKALTAFDEVDEWSGWKTSALEVMKEKDTQFDVVLSTIPPYSTAFLGMELAAYYQCKFVLDYRDPWAEMLQIMLSSGECSARKLHRHTKFEDKCLNASDLILAVSPGISGPLGNRLNKKILTIPQGFEGEIAKSEHDDKSKYLLYAGSLAYGRNISSVLSAIKNVVETYDEKMKLVYCGIHSDLAYEQANSVDATAYIDIKGPVGEHDVLEYAKGSLCNIVIISAGYEYAYPGKLFDLMPAGRPIYVVSQSGSEAGTLVEKYGIGYSIAASDIANLAQKVKDEIGREFRIPSKVNELKVERIYQRMLDEGLGML